MKEICKDFPPYQRLQVKNPWEGSWKKWERMKKEAGS
jgi:ribosome modulation factor